MSRYYVTRERFNKAVEAVWSEIEYQNDLSRRTEEGEAKDVPGFLTLGRRYLREAEDQWADTEAGIIPAGDEMAGGTGLSYTPANQTMRKLAAIFIRGMIYTGIYARIYPSGKGST